MPDFKHSLSIASVLVFVVSAPIAASDSSGQWRQFRGPQGNGVAVDAHPVRWGDQQNLGWTADLPGGGWSSPVIAGQHVYVTTAVSSDGTRPKGFGDGVSSMRSFYQSKPPEQPFSFEVHCLDLANGQLLWSKQVALEKPKHKIHPSNSYATESPVADADHVYAYFAAVGVVACLDSSGELLWKRDLGSYRTSSDFGTASSLAMWKDKLYVQCDNEERSFVCALDKSSGNEAWRIKRESRTSWSSPILWTNRERSELVVCGSGQVTSYHPESGEVLWNLTGTGGAFSASPTCDEQRIYFGNSGRNSRGPLIAVNAGASGPLTLDSIGPNGVAWLEETSAPGMCSPVVVDDRLYVLSRGILSCHDSSTGQRFYRKRLQNASSVTSSLWASGGHVFALNESGTTAVIKVGDEFELVGSNTQQGLFWATPSVAGSSLLLRGASRLHCVREQGERLGQLRTLTDSESIR